jgi:hypothetical protein
MPIRFPDFKDTRCMAVTACGSLDTDEKEILDVIERLEKDVLIAPYRSGTINAYIRVLLGGSSPKHVHIDVYRKEVFGNSLPEPTHKRKDIEKLLDGFLGQKISTYAFGRFFLPREELPEGGLIRTTFFETRQGDLGITMTRADFAIRGAPIRGLAWQLVDRGARVRIDVDVMVETTISRDYLIEQFQLIDSGFRLFVMGERPDDTD